MRLSYPLPLPLLHPAVFLSGATALVYEIVWTRRLSLVLGSTTEAVAAVLSAFMLGLAVGAVLVGRRSDRSRRPLRWYGLLELGIGVYALAFDSILELTADRLTGSPWLVACALLVLPAALMGGTLPVLARTAADTTERGTRALGGLYGANTLGAVAGAVLTTLFLLERLGMSGTVQLAAGINIALGVGFWILAMACGQRDAFAAEEDERGRGWRGDAEVSIVTAFFLAGFAGLALETAWVRLLVYYLEGFTIAFGLMLATYLLGLGGGALWGTVVALRSGNPRRLLARILMVGGVLAVATLLAAPLVGSGLESMRRSYSTAAHIDFSYALGLFGAAAVVILPATFCAGMLLPVVARIALSDRESIGKQAGVVYAASTCGAVLAPPLAAFWIIPTLGVTGTIAAMGALLLLAGTALALRQGLREWVFAGAAAVVLVAAGLAAGLGRPAVLSSHVFVDARTPRRLRAFQEGTMAGVSVVEELKDGTRRLYLDGFSAAETGPHYGYMRLLGHLPVLLHPAPEDVLVIAFGTGTTAGAVSLHPEVKRIVCVEIEPAVYDVAGEFSVQNRGVLGDERTQKLVADGREFVRRGSRCFDVVTLEPLMPYTPAAVYLYTKEFYQEVRKSLAPNGLLCQWIPPQGVSNADLKRLVASVQATFQHVSLWYFPHAVLVLGADKAPYVDAAGFLQRSARREVLEDLHTALVGGPAYLLGAEVCSGKALRDALGDTEPMVDDRTDLEYRPLPRRFGKRSMTYHAENLEFLSGLHDPAKNRFHGAVPGVEQAARSFGAALGTLALEMRRRAEGGAIVPASVLQTVLARDRGALFALSIAHRRLYRELMKQGRFAEAAQLRYAPDRSAAYVALAKRSEGERRHHYLILAVGQNGLIEPALLRELAASGTEPERRFLLNRARAQEGEELEPGEESLSEVELPDLEAALKEGRIEDAKEALAFARRADLGESLDELAWNWWKAQEDQRAALEVLVRIESNYASRAALRLVSQGAIEDLVAVAPFFAGRYPGDRTWERLCSNASPTVRDAAAEAAASMGGPAHLEQLLLLCRDSVESVRLSAYVAFRGMRPEADQTGYDYKQPTEESLAKLEDLLGR